MLHQGNYIESVARNKKVTKVELATRTGVHRLTIARWLEQERIPLPDLEKLSRALNYNFQKEFYSVPVPAPVKNESLSEQRIREIKLQGKVELLEKLLSDKKNKEFASMFEKLEKHVDESIKVLAAQFDELNKAVMNDKKE